VPWWIIHGHYTVEEELHGWGRNSTTQMRSDIRPTSSMEFFLHCITAMDYPPRHVCLPLYYENNAEYSVPNAHPCLAPCTLFQVHNPIAVALLWTLLSRTSCICTTRIDVSSCYIILRTGSRHQQQTRCTLYSYKKEYNLKMANIEAETCSCWHLSAPPVAVINIVVFWLYVWHICG
jgi:hypothetical protein